MSTTVTGIPYGSFFTVTPHQRQRSVPRKWWCCRAYPLERWMRNNLYPWNTDVLVVMSCDGEARYSLMHLIDDVTLEVEGELQMAPAISDVKIEIKF